jgi:hypothetical protein
MKKAAFLFLFVFITVSTFAQVNLEALRKEYAKASSDSALCAKMYQRLSKTDNSNNVITGYRGAAAALMADHSKGKAEKLKFFREGRSLLEQSIIKDNSNAELRLLRLSIQSNCPKVLNYNKDIPADKKFILDNYKTIKDQGLKTMLRDFCLKSSAFSSEEKKQFQ